MHDALTNAKLGAGAVRLQPVEGGEKRDAFNAMEQGFPELRRSGLGNTAVYKISRRDGRPLEIFQKRSLVGAVLSFHKNGAQIPVQGVYARIVDFEGEPRLVLCGNSDAVGNATLALEKQGFVS